MRQIKDPKVLIGSILIVLILLFVLGIVVYIPIHNSRQKSQQSRNAANYTESQKIVSENFERYLQAEKMYNDAEFASAEQHDYAIEMDFYSINIKEINSDFVETRVSNYPPFYSLHLSSIRGYLNL